MNDLHGRQIALEKLASELHSGKKELTMVSGGYFPPRSGKHEKILKQRIVLSDS